MDTQQIKDMRIVKGLIIKELDSMIEQYPFIKTFTSKKDYDTDLSTVKTPACTPEIRDRWNGLRRSMGNINRQLRAAERVNKSEIDDDNDATYRHESYASIQLTAPQGQASLFGSAVRHQHFISLRITRAEMKRSIQHDHLHPTEELIEVNMSHEQWGRFISSVGRGEGTPCTLRYVNGVACEAPPLINKKEEFQKEFAAKMDSLAKRVSTLKEQARELLGKKEALSRVERTTLTDMIGNICQEMESNIPYVVTCYNETMEKVTTQAVIEVESFVNSLAQRTGLTTLQNAQLIPQIASEKPVNE